MPATVILDIVEGSELDDGIAASTLKRVAYVHHLDAGALQGDPSVMLRALVVSGMPQFFDPHPSNANYFCNRRVVRPETDSSCYVDLYYFRGAIQGSTWLMTESSTTVSDTTQVHPSGKQILLQLDTGTGATARTQQWIATTPYPRVVRRITYEGTVIGFNIPGTANSQPPSMVVGGGISPTQVAKKDKYTAAINHVNSAPWQGLGIGYWWFNDWEVRTPDRGASNTIRASFISKVDQDWSTYEVLRDSNMNKFITVDPAAIAALQSQPYAFDVLYPLVNGKSTWGIAKVGNFPLADFIPLFGN
jgi:hypothetical protein